MIPIKEHLIEDFNDKVSSFFKGLTFVSSSHEYFVENTKIPISVSGLIKGFVEKTDWDKIATAIAKREGTTKEAILAKWAEKNKIACDNGTKTHDFAENLNSLSKASTPKEQAVLKFWKDLDKNNPGRYVLIGIEVRMYHKVYKFSGTCDFVLYDRLSRMYIIGDYKTNEDLFKNFKEKTLLPPFDFLLDCPYNHYQIQLSLYELLLEQTNFMVSERWLIYLQGDGEYRKYPCHNYTGQLTDWLDQKHLIYA